MKLGAVLVIYVIFGIWAATHTIAGVLVTIGVLLLICGLMTLISRVFCSDRTVSFWIRGMKKLFVIEIIGLI